MASDRGAMSAIPPITAHHLAEVVQAGHHGARDALDNQPPASSASPSQTELTLLARVVELFTTIRQEAAATLNGLQAEIAARREQFTQERYEGRIRSIEAAMRALLNRHGGELEQRVYDALKAKREYEFFNYTHKRSADPKVDKWQFILLFLIVPLTLESLLNGNFFARSERVRSRRRRGDGRHHLGAQHCAGLPDGARAGALLPACAPIASALGAARLCRADHPDRDVQPRGGALSRDADRDARCAIAAGPAAADGHPFAITELKSAALVIIGCLVAFAAAVKGYSAFGTYPAMAPPISAGASAGAPSRRSGAGSMPNSCPSWRRCARASTASRRTAPAKAPGCNR